MKRMILLSMAGVVALTVYALAQQAGGVPSKSTGRSMQPATGPQGMMARCSKGMMMRKAGMGPAMMKRMQVMMRTPIFLDSPSAIYGQAAALKLSDGQKARLVRITSDARKKALAVLTPAQRKKMGDIPAKPMAMMQMCRQMRAKMMPMMRKMMGGKGGPMMMRKMMGGKGKPMMMRKMMGGKGKPMMACPKK